MRLISYLQLMRFDKPVGTLLLLWPTVMALVLTKAEPSTCAIFVLGVVVMRAAGCVINDYADRNFDPHVARTKQRPLATGIITAKQALGLFFSLMLLALFLAIQLKPYTLLLAVCAAMLAVLYPFAKRIFAYPQFVLGVAFAWGVFMVYAETIGHISLQALILFSAIVCWVLAYDTQYAMADIADDLRIGIKSSAISFGNYGCMAVLLLQVLAILGLGYLGANLWLLAAALCTVVYQQWLLKDIVPGSNIRAFKNNNYTGLFMTLALWV